MPVINLKLNGENAWPDLQGKSIIHMGQGAPAIEMALLDNGMESGAPSLAMRFDLPDGKALIVETSAQLYCSIARVIMGKYPELLN